MLTGIDSEFKTKPYVTDFIRPFIWIFISHLLSVRISLDTGAVRPWGQPQRPGGGRTLPVARLPHYQLRLGPDRDSGRPRARGERANLPAFQSSVPEVACRPRPGGAVRGAGAVAGVPGREVL